MDERDRVRELLKASRTAAAEQMAALKACGHLDYPTADRCLRAYILSKYLLTEDDLPEGELFADIIQVSLSKSLGISRELVQEFDRARTCDGTTSAMAKKILLILSIQRELGIILDETACARIGTLGDFTRLIFDTMCVTEPWREKITV